MRLGAVVAIRNLEEADTRLYQLRAAGLAVCQLNLHGVGCQRPTLLTLADKVLEHEARPVAVGCYVNPLQPDTAGPLGATRTDLEHLLHQLDIIGARRVVFFSGSYASTLFDPHPENASDAALDKLAEFVTEICRNTRAGHYQLVIEPWHGHVLSHEDRIVTFHGLLAPAVADHVRYVVDAPTLIGPDRYSERDKVAARICRAIGRAAGVVHLRDIIAPPDGDAGLPGPGEGKLDYKAYVDALKANVHADTPALIRNVPPEELGRACAFLTGLSDTWQLQ